MMFFLKATRIFLVILVLGAGGCSSFKNEELYGYEDDFAFPEPDMIPVFSDDKPGRTVDEMLNLKPQEVVVQKASSEKRASETYEHEGRFGSKEKIALRKGLNAPVTEIVYGTQKRKAAEEIRSLEIKKHEKSEDFSASEEDVLAEIVAPKMSETKMIEVVPVQSVQKTEKEPERFLPKLQVEEKASAQNKVDEMVASLPEKTQSEEQPSLRQEEARKKDTIVLVAPVKLKAPETKRKGLLLKPLIKQEKIVLVPPRNEGRIVLKRPEQKENVSSVDIFLDE